MTSLILLLLATYVAANDHHMFPLNNSINNNEKLHDKNNPIRRITLPPDLVERHGAYCLDGSPYHYFFRPTSDPEHHQDDYVLYFQGGGWCYSLESCRQRTQSYLGSSTHWPDYIHHDPTLLSLRPDVNPLFAKYNHVFLGYCDGASFAGSRNGPVFVDESSDDELWFRGRHNLDSVLDHLGLTRTARRVLITGCSSGGLTTYLHADPIRQQLPKTAVVKALPESGLFLWHANARQQPVYEQGMRTVFDMQNCSRGTNQACIQAGEGSKCLAAETLLRYIDTPLFLYESVYDSWNIRCVLTAATSRCDAALPAWDDCVNSVDEDYSACSPPQIDQLGDLGDFLLARVATSGWWRRPQHGAFLHSCFSHCSLEEHGPTVLKYLTLQGTSLQTALEKWWNDNGPYDNDNGNVGSLQEHPHMYFPCRIQSNRSSNETMIENHQCNPTCQLAIPPEVLAENS